MQISSLKPFLTLDPSEEHKQDFSCLSTSCGGASPDITGFMSSCEHGTGRGSTDRQYLFINGRPCEFDKVELLSSVHVSPILQLCLCLCLCCSCVYVYVYAAVVSMSMLQLCLCLCLCCLWKNVSVLVPQTFYNFLL